MRIPEEQDIKVTSIIIERRLIKIIGYDILKFNQSKITLEKLFDAGSQSPAVDSICIVKLCEELFERCRILELDTISQSAVISLLDSNPDDVFHVSFSQLRTISLSSSFSSPDTFCSEYYLAQLCTIDEAQTDGVEVYLEKLKDILLNNEKFIKIKILKTVYNKHICEIISNDIPGPEEGIVANISLEEQVKMITDYEEKKKSNQQQIRPIARNLKAPAPPKFSQESDSGEELFSPYFTYKVNALAVNSVHQVRVSFIEKGVNLFYVKLIALDSRFQEMTTKIQAMPLTPLREKPKVAGMACLARYDKKVHRVAIVKSVFDQKKGHELYVCHFVDFGFSASVRLENLFYIPNEFIADEAFAISFSFSGLKNLNFKVNPTELQFLFRQLVENKSFTLKCVAPDGPQSCQYCELYDGSNANILQILKLFDPFNTKIAPQHKLKIKTNMSVKVCYVESTNEFYIQNQDPKECLHYETLDFELQKQMKFSPLIKNPQVGMCCGVLIDNEWFRGEIVRQVGNDTVSVKIIDFGIVEEVPITSIRMLSYIFYQTPSFAYRCCLKGFENLQVSDNVSTQFDIFCSDGKGERRVFKMLVDDLKSFNYIVELEDESISPPANVNRILLKNSRPLAETITLENAKKRQKENSSSKKENNVVQTAPTPPKEVTVKEVKTPERNRNSPQRGRGNYKGTQRPLPAETENVDKRQRTHFGNKGDKQSGNFFKTPKDASSNAMTKSTSSSSFETYQRDATESSKSRKSKSPKSMPEKKQRERLKREKSSVDEKSTVKKIEKKYGWVSTVVSVNRAFIHFEENVTGLKRILDGMYAYYQNNPDPSKDVKKEAFIAYLSADGNYYRGRIKNIKGGMCQVFNMEYGNHELIKKSKIFDLTPEFEKEENVLNETYFAIQATKCDKNEELLKAMKEIFQEGSVELKFEIVKTFKNGTIMEILDDKNERYFDQLVTKKIAKRISDDELKRALNDERMFEEIDNDVELEEAVEEKKAREEVKTDSSRIRGKITALTTPNDFYLSSFDALDNFKELHNDIQCVVPAMSPLLDFECGTKCLAKSPYDNLWYRAKIIDSDHSLISVLCIDNGKTFSFDNKASLKILPEQLSRKSFGMACSLPVSIERKSEETATNVMLATVDKIAEYEIILSTPDKTFVEIIVNGENMKDYLVEKNLAKAFEIFKSGTGYTSHINSLEDFYIQLESEQVKLELIGSIFERANGEFPKLKEPKVNQIVAAKYEDGLWYRGKIESIDKNEYNVKFIDYGNSSVTKEIGQVDRSIAEIAEMSKQCRLVKPKNLLYFSEAAEKKFIEICDNGSTILDVKVIKPGIVTEVELFCNGQNIIDQLTPLCTLHDSTDDD